MTDLQVGEKDDLRLRIASFRFLGTLTERKAEFIAEKLLRLLFADFAPKLESGEGRQGHIRACRMDVIAEHPEALHCVILLLRLTEPLHHVVSGKIVGTHPEGFCPFDEGFQFVRREPKSQHLDPLVAFCRHVLVWAVHRH